jgi:hypothetical protein
MTHHIPDDDYSSSSSHDHSFYQPKKQTPEEKLIADLRSQLASVQGKSGEKHQHKTDVLQEAIKVLRGTSDTASLRESIDNNPRYNEAMFSSKTEKLINKVFEMKGDSPGHEMK